MRSIVFALASLLLASAAEADEARTGDRAGVVRVLDGHTESARELESRIASLRASGGSNADIARDMRLYLSLYPTGRMATSYRQYLAAHGL